MSEKNVSNIKDLIANHQFDLLEAIGFRESNHQRLKHIIFRAEIYHGINPRYCQERKTLITPDSLKKLQEYAFYVYLNQNRDLQLSYQKTIDYLCFLLNQNLGSNTLYTLSANQFMDEVQSYLPVADRKNKISGKNRVAMVSYIVEQHEEQVKDALLLQSHHAYKLCDVVRQAEMFRQISPNTCREYTKVTKPLNLEKLQTHGKNLWKEAPEGTVTYKQITDDICFLLNHNVLMAKVLAMDLTTLDARCGELEQVAEF